MRKITYTYIWSFFIAISLLGITAHAQNAIDGSLGVDLHVLSSSSESNENSYDKVDGSRSLSNHYMSFKRSGNIKNNNFASYSLFTTLKGYFISTNTGDIRIRSYSSPSLNSLAGSMTFFPKRPFPLNVYYRKYKNVSLKFNETNRSKTELLTPGLAVLQKNRIDDKKYGSTFSSTLFKGATFEATYDKSAVSNSYDYDFDENKNILLTSIELTGDIFSNTVPILFNNSINDDSVRIVSGTINEIIPPGITTTILFDSGFHFIDIIPLHIYKQNSLSINLGQGERYIVKIEVEDFPSQSENIKESTLSEFKFDYSGNAFTINTSYSYEDALRKNTGLKEIDKLTKNKLKYDISKKLILAVNTEFVERENSQDNVIGQVVNNFKNNSILNFQQRRGLIGSISHEYKDDKSINPEGTADNSKNTRFTSRISLPSEKFKHNISLNSELSLQDQTGRTSSKTTNKSMMLTNNMVFYFKKIKLIPLTTIKIDSRNKVADSLETDSEELNITSSFEGSKTETRLFGDVLSKLKHSYSKSTENAESKNNSLFAWELVLIKKISKDQSISLNTSHSWKFISDEHVMVIDTITKEFSTKTIAIPSQYTNATSIMYTSAQFEDIDFSTTLSVSNSPGSKLVGISILLDTYIPYLKLPFSTELMQQSRALEGLPGQSSFKVESLISYRYNQINLRISHIYSSEKLILDTYKFYEFSVNLTRSFGIF